MGVRRNITSNSAASIAARDSYVRGVLALKREMQNLTTADLGFGVAPGQSHQQLSTWEFFVIWHVRAMGTMTPASSLANPRGRNAAHRGPVFLPWHRWFMILLEWQFQRVLGDPNFGIPYWDWAADGNNSISQQPSRPIWSTNAMGGNGTGTSGNVNSGPFRGSQFRIRIEVSPDGDLRATDRPLRRSFGTFRPPQFGGPFGLPNKGEVGDAMDQTAYDGADWDVESDGFRNWCEGWTPVAPGISMLHNRIHVWIGGDMGPSTSPNDPAFFLNHCNVDRMWSAWQARNPTRPYVPSSTESNNLFRHRRNDTMVSVLTQFAPTPAQVLNVNQLYTYDSLAVD